MGSCCDCLKKKENNDGQQNNEKKRNGQKQQQKSKSKTKTNGKEKKKVDLRNIAQRGKAIEEEGKKSVYAVTFNKIDEDNRDEKTSLIPEEVLQRELKQAVKGGESAYGKQIQKTKPSLHTKSLPPANYNKSGLVSHTSSEYKQVNNYLHRRGYQLQAAIGSGNYAEVYKAKKIDRQKYVAVKVIDLKKASNNYRLRFLPHEIELLQKLKHPNIIKIYEIAQTSNRIYMVMELAENGNIADWIKEKGAFTEMTGRAMFKKIVGALTYMHSCHIAHRDLKIENILVTSKLYPKVSDFSYAKLVDEENVWSTTFCGSMPYMAPEILQKQQYNPLISDMWSLGICLYVMLNDALPYSLKDPRKMLKSQLNKDWSFNKRVDSKLSAQVKHCVRTMLEPDVSKRATVHTLAKDPWICGHKTK